MSRVNKLFSKAKAISASYSLPFEVAKEMSSCMIWFTASSGEVVMYDINSNFSKLFTISDRANKHYRTQVMPWRICGVVVDKNLLNGSLNLNLTIYEGTDSYEEIAKVVYEDLVQTINKINPNRRKNICMFGTTNMGYQFTDNQLDTLIALDPDFDTLSSIKTEGDVRRELRNEINLLSNLVS